MKDWKPVDFIMALFAFTITFMLIAVMLEVVLDNREMSDGQAKRVNVIVNGIIAIISMYVGAQIQKNKGQ